MREKKKIKEGSDRDRTTCVEEKNKKKRKRKKEKKRMDEMKQEKREII